MKFFTYKASKQTEYVIFINKYEYFFSVDGIHNVTAQNTIHVREAKKIDLKQIPTNDIIFLLNHVKKTTKLLGKNKNYLGLHYHNLKKLLIILKILLIK